MDIYSHLNQTEFCFEDNIGIINRILRHAENKPDSIAITDGENKITYRQLEEKTNRIAIYLNKTYGYQQRIAVIQNRSLEQIISAAAILRSGNIYVPIDISYPEKRIVKIIEDCQCILAITKNDYLQIYDNLLSNKAHIISYENIPDKLCNDECMVQQNSQDIAYILYTSGTTGDPKGVVVTNQSVNNTLCWLEKEFELTDEDIIAFRTSISFTDSIWEIFLPLMTGAGIRVISEDIVRDMELLYSSLEQVTLAQFVPSALKLFLDYIERKGIENPLPDLRWLFSSGEYLDISLAKRWYRNFRKVDIANLYGMTESAIFATSYVVRRDKVELLNQIPIGKPIANIACYLLSDTGNLCKRGELGEIYICGIGIAKGYWNQENMDKDRFVESTIYKGIGYRTGDLGRINENGDLDYYGRKDDQVKIYGNRVELSDVEQNIIKVVGSKNVAVIASKNIYGENSLICFYTDNREDITTLRNRIMELLPKYMLPSQFIYINQIPLTINNKVDRKRLLEIADQNIHRNDEIKEQLLGIWRVLLPNVDIQPESNIFDMGGDSFSLIRMQAMLDILGIKVNYHDIRSHPTINELVEIIRGSEHA